MAEQLTSNIESFIEARRTPGIGAVILDRTGKKLFDFAKGPNSIDDTSKGSFTSDTQLNIASCTKLITCICVLQLLEQGRISSIEDPVAKYFPRQAQWKVASKVDKDGTPHLHEPQRQITFRDFFTHTSGMTYDFFGRDELLHQYRVARNQQSFTTANTSQEWHYFDAFLAFEPGQSFQYGMNIDQLGFTLEEITGMRLEDYMKQNIFDPLGMNKTGPEPTTDDFLRFHATIPDGKVVALEDARPPSKDIVWKYGGGHFLTSTLNDYSKILVTLLNEGTHPSGVQILRPETVREYVFKDLMPDTARKNLVEPIGFMREGLVPGVCSAGDPGQILAKSDERGWSAAFMINKEDAPGGRKSGSGSWAGLPNMYYWVDPVSELTGIIATCKLPFCDKDFLDLFVEFEKFAYSQKW